MSQIATTTTAINTDEPCLQLVEMNLVRPDKPGIDRYMIVTVIRNDRPVDFWIDLGPAKQFRADQFRIPGGGKDETTGRYWCVHIVGELVDMANHIREGPYQPPEPPPTHDLIGAYYDQPDLRSKRRKGRSTFGFGGTLQRS